ncbi:hypothetical protein Tco_0271530 [Tanacetum coccineum]
MLTARKRVHLFLTRIPANRRRLYSSSSSLPSKRCRTSSYSSSSKGSLSERSLFLVSTHLSSLSAGPSRKRCRSLATLVSVAAPTLGALVPVQADLLPPYKSIRDSSSTLSPEDSYKAYTEPDVDSDVRTNIEADIAAKAAAAEEIRIDRATELEITKDIPAPVDDEGDKETFDIGLDMVIQELYDHMVDIHVQRITNIEEEQRRLENMAPKRATRSTRVPPVTPVTPAPNAPTTTTVTEAQLQALINQGVALQCKA